MTGEPSRTALTSARADSLSFVSAALVLGAAAASMHLHGSGLERVGANPWQFQPGNPSG